LSPPSAIPTPRPHPILSSSVNAASTTHPVAHSTSTILSRGAQSFFGFVAGPFSDSPPCFCSTLHPSPFIDVPLLLHPTPPPSTFLQLHCHPLSLFVCWVAPLALEFICRRTTFAFYFSGAKAVPPRLSARGWIQYRGCARAT
jgi:hypothetical protein